MARAFFHCMSESSKSAIQDHARQWIRKSCNPWSVFYFFDEDQRRGVCVPSESQNHPQSNTMKKLDLELLNQACSGHGAALRIRTKLLPVGGADDKIFPPTYAGEKHAVYAV